MKKAIITCAIVVVLGLGLGVGQGESEQADLHESHDIDVLDRNIRLTFEMVDEQGQGEKPVSIVTAVPKYKLAGRFEDEDGQAVVSVFGAVGPRNDGRILALLEVEIVFAADEAETELAAECGVLLKPGEAQEAARWGNRALMVHAEYAD